MACVVYLGITTATRLEAKIYQEAKNALVSGGHNWAEIEVDGQTIRLSGYASSQTEVESAEIAVLTSLGPGGVVSGGVTKVLNQSEVVSIAAPYFWRADKQEGFVTFSGYVSSRTEKKEIFDAAYRSFPGRVIDNSEFAQGAPTDVDWASAARFGLEQLNGLETGYVELTDDAIRITGDAASMSAMDQIAEAALGASHSLVVITNITGPYHWAATIEADQLSMTGNIPDIVARDLFYNLAQFKFEGPVKDHMAIGGEVGWTDQAVLMLDYFTQFESGELYLERGVFHLTGEVEKNLYASMLEGLSELPPNFQLDVDVIAKRERVTQ